jgi:scyllo-inositol 2-dehydrogenase (NADP+)
MQTIKTALCSYGMSGKIFHAPFLQVHEGFELIKCWERTTSKINADYPLVQSVNSFDALLEKDVDLVIVNTPNITHYNLVKKALQAGKHVVVEKPFSTTVQEAKELVALAVEKNLVLTVYHNRRFDSDFLTIQKVLNENKIGNVVEAELHFDRYVPALSAKLHKEQGDKGTGALYDLGSHLIDQALQLFGLPTAVFANIEGFRPNTLVDDFFELILYYPKSRVRVKGSYFAKWARPYIFHGTEGSFIKPKTNNQEIALQNGVSPMHESMGVEKPEEWGFLYNNQLITPQKLASSKGNYMAFYENVYQAICLQQPLFITATQAMQVIQIIEAACTSHEQKRVVEL